MGYWFIGIFFMLVALMLVVSAVGLKFIEKQRKRKVGEMLLPTHGIERVPSGDSILRDSPDDASWTDLIKSFPLYQPIEAKLALASLDTRPAAILGAMCVTGAIGLFLGLRIQAPLLREAAALLLGFTGFMLPYIWVGAKANKRMAAFEEMFPEALDFLARSMRAGHAFSVSLEMMAEETPDPVGSEFRKVFHEQNLGAPMEATLKLFAERIPLLDTKFFVASVLLQRETGGNLAEILTKLSYIIRERFRLKGQVKAASAHGRITAVILAVMPLVTLLLLNIVAPDYFKYMLEDKDGRWIILAVVVLQAVGYMWMRKIINIKV